jgi:selenocysteine lyase/cysteine desulfurase
MMARRELIQGAAGLAASAANRGLSGARAMFPWAEEEVYLNNAGWHPMSRQAVAAMQGYLEYKLKGPGGGRGERQSGSQELARARFAQLIHARPEEVAFVPSTLVGENLVVSGLGIPARGGNVVTDELHYEGSLFLYRTLERQAGLDLRIAPAREGRVELSDLERLVDRNTRLVALSFVSYLNGFVPDVKRVCDLAHAHGAHVYTDVIQAAGAVPIDVRALGIDFCACSGYKWLMGDRGLGFLFVREDLQGKVLRRTQFGDRQFAEFQYHMYPHDPPGERPASWKAVGGARGHYEVGNIANIVAAGHAESLRQILEWGVERIQAHARPLAETLRKELPALGYPCLTPPGTPSPISSFVVEKPEKLRERLRKANVTVKIEWNQTRISPSVYNHRRDIDALLNALS